MSQQTFRPAETAQTVLELNPHMSQKALMRATRALIATEEEEALSNSLNDLPHQGRMMRQFDGNGAALWALGVGNLSPEPLKFVLNATVESLPTNANLHKWGKGLSASCPLCHGDYQSLCHILNDCPMQSYGSSTVYIST